MLANVVANLSVHLLKATNEGQNKAIQYDLYVVKVNQKQWGQVTPRP